MIMNEDIIAIIVVVLVMTCLRICGGKEEE